MYEEVEPIKGNKFPKVARISSMSKWLNQIDMRDICWQTVSPDIHMNYTTFLTKEQYHDR